jgi:hypothetical protein
MLLLFWHHTRDTHAHGYLLCFAENNPEIADCLQDRCCGPLRFHEVGVSQEQSELVAAEACCKIWGALRIPDCGPNRVRSRKGCEGIDCKICEIQAGVS